MSAQWLLRELEQLEKINRKTLAKIRKQVDDPNSKVSARAIIKFLVDNELISRKDGVRLLEASAAADKVDVGQATVPLGMRAKEQDTDDLLGDNFHVPLPVSPEKLVPTVDRVERARDEGWTVADPTLIPAVPKQDDQFFADAPQFGKDRPFANDLAMVVPVAETEPVVEPNFPGKRVYGNPWESKWLFLGFGLLGLLVMTSVGLWWFLTRTTAEDAYAAADKEFNEGHFAAARDAYVNFVQNYAIDPKVPEAKAKAVNALLRSFYNTNNWAQTKKAAMDELPKLSLEEGNQLVVIQDELSVILPKSVLGLSQKAVAAATTEEKRSLLVEAEELMGLINTPAIIPPNRLRADYVLPILADHQKNVDQVRFEIEREDAYQSNLMTIAQMVQSGDTNKASISYHALVQTYPILKTRQPLIDLVATISAKESQLVVPVEVALATTADDIPAKSLARTMMVAQTGPPISDLEGKIITYLINGTVYGLAADDGSVVWWRRVGFQTSLQPQWVEAPHQSDVIICDQTKQQLLRVSAADGRLIWRTEINEPFLKPAITKGKIFVTSGGGERSKVIRINIDNGQVELACQLPQSATVGPVAHADVSVLYQMGRHSSLYILSQEDLKCVEVHYLGHQPDSIDVEPFLISGNLCVLVNFAQSCQAYVYGFKQRGLEAIEAQPPFKITEGKVSLNAYRYGRSVILSSDTGDLRMYELAVSLDGDQSAATMQPQIAGTFPTFEGVANYFVADRGNLYMANKGLTKYRIQRSKEDFELRKSGDATDLFIGPLFAFENAIIHLRRRFHSSMITAAAVNPETLEEIWRTDFAAPSLDQPMVMDNRLLTFSEQGDLFELTSDAFQTGTVKPQVRGSAVNENLQFDRRITLADGTLVLIGQDCDRVLSYRPPQMSEARLSPMQAPANRPGGEPEGFGKHILVPTLEGQVVRIDPMTGLIVGAPFQPATNPNQTVRWTRPAVLEEQNAFVIATTTGNVYSVQAEGDQSLVRKGQLEYAAAFVSPLVRIEDKVVGVCREAGADRIIAFNVFPELAEVGTKPLDPPYVGQLAAIGTQLFFVTADAKLNCWNSDLTVRWQVDLPYKMVGQPQVSGETLLIAFDNGDIARFDKATGKAIQSISLDQPLSAAPFEYNGNWYVSDQQGVVHVMAPIE